MKLVLTHPPLSLVAFKYQIVACSIVKSSWNQKKIDNSAGQEHGATQVKGFTFFTPAPTLTCFMCPDLNLYFTQAAYLTETMYSNLETNWNLLLRLHVPFHLLWMLLKEEYSMWILNVKWKENSQMWNEKKMIDHTFELLSFPFIMQSQLWCFCNVGLKGSPALFRKYGWAWLQLVGPHIWLGNIEWQCLWLSVEWVFYH